jgi:hypothetical protein
MAATKYPNKKAFKEVSDKLAAGEELTFALVGDVFGPDFWVLVTSAFMDAQDAARAIQGAINRISQETGEEVV